MKKEIISIIKQQAIRLVIATVLFVAAHNFIVIESPEVQSEATVEALNGGFDEFEKQQVTIKSVSYILTAINVGFFVYCFVIVLKTIDKIFSLFVRHKILVVRQNKPTN